MQDLRTFSYEEVCIFLRRLCQRIVKMEDCMSIHQIDMKNCACSLARFISY